VCGRGRKHGVQGGKEKMRWWEEGKEKKRRQVCVGRGKGK
jgi:hypothetical protein